MAEYRISNVQNPEPDDLLKGIWLMLYRPEQIPPHLILVIEGEYFSLSVNGLKSREHISSLIRNALAKQHSILAIKVKFTGIPVHLQREADELFKKYSCPEEGITTCLYPIRDFFANHVKQDLKQAEFVFELYEKLNASGKTGKAIHYNLNQLLDREQCFHLRTYTRSDIDQCIRELKNKPSA
ncbi:MAG: hypothetical protein ACK40M_02380 [Flavobacteriales bacterium]